MTRWSLLLLAFFSFLQLAGAAPEVYLTFDDGPLAGTDDCIAVLKDEHIIGTFFMVGAHTPGQFAKNQIKAVKDNGFLQANHSKSHWAAASNYEPNGKTSAEWLTDFSQCDQAIAVHRGDPATTKYKHARLPGKNCWRADGVAADDGNSKRVGDHLHANGYLIYGWDVEWEYSGNAAASDPKGTPDEAATKVASALSQGPTKKSGKIIVLLHDHQFRTSRGNKTKLSEFIKLLRQKVPGVKFKSIADY
jgi:peptidoglycan/xylan/chitin deacetylase (PgdA/CDA1 family)